MADDNEARWAADGDEELWDASAAAGSGRREPHWRNRGEDDDMSWADRVRGAGSDQSSSARGRGSGGRARSARVVGRAPWSSTRRRS